MKTNMTTIKNIKMYQTSSFFYVWIVLPDIIKWILSILKPIFTSQYGSMHLVILICSLFPFLILLVYLQQKDSPVIYSQIVALSGTYMYLVNCCCLLFYYNRSWMWIDELGYHFRYTLPLISNYNLNFSLGITGVSLLLLFLTGFIMTLCLFALNPEEKNYKTYVVYLYLVYTFLTLSFCVTNLFFFFIFFESVLIPMFLMIGLWGARPRKIKAAYYFIFFTLLGSFFLLFGIYKVYKITGSLEYDTILTYVYTRKQQRNLFFFFFIAFAIKIPMFPFYIWLPEAHVEAPTVGSVILAALLLKLGGYGFVKFLNPMFPLAIKEFAPWICALAAIGFLVASFIAFCQSDLKRIIAYSSIAHMNVIVVGLMMQNINSIHGGIYLMIAHGIASAGLFFCVGILYDRYRTRQIKHYSSMVETMPIFSAFFFFFTLGNIGFPGTCNFVGEFLCLVGIFGENALMGFITATNMVWSAVYAVWLYNRISFGTLKTEKQNIINSADVNRTEFLILLSLMIATVILGFAPSFVLALL